MKASAVCGELIGRHWAVPAPKDLASVTSFVGQELLAGKSLPMRLESLRPPASDGSAYSEFLSTSRQQLAKSPEVKSAAETRGRTDGNESDQCGQCTRTVRRLGRRPDRSHGMCQGNYPTGLALSWFCVSRTVLPQAPAEGQPWNRFRK